MAPTEKEALREAKEWLVAQQVRERLIGDALP